MRLDQVLVTAAPGDATTGSAMELRSLLRRVGPSEIYAHHIDPRLLGDVIPLTEFDRDVRGQPRGRDDLLIFHGSIGAPDVFSFVEARRERLLLVYHNISPATAYMPYDPTFAALLAGGRRDIAQLAARCVLAITPSAFNARELQDMGFADVRVWPLVVDLDQIRNIPPDPATTEQLAALEGPLLLFLGQLLPHKRPDFLVQAFHILSTYLMPEAHLALVGAPRLEPYRRQLYRFIDELQLPRLHRVGHVPDDVFAAYWRRADAFVTASEHEGFLQPVLEAMAFDVPVVARSFGAVPDTVGGAGIVLGSHDGPAVFAEAMATVLTDKVLRAELVARGRRRLEDFDPEQTRAAFYRHLVDVA